MSDTLIFGLVLSFFVLIVIFIIVNNYKRKQSSWTGVVIDKGFDEHIVNNTMTTSRSPRNNSAGSNIKIGNISIGGMSNRNQSHVSFKYYIVIKTQEDKELKWSISEGLYEKINLGDTLNKPSGTMIPLIVSVGDNN